MFKIIADKVTLDIVKIVAFMSEIISHDYAMWQYRRLGLAGIYQVGIAKGV